MKTEERGKKLDERTQSEIKRISALVSVRIREWQTLLSPKGLISLTDFIKTRKIKNKSCFDFYRAFAESTSTRGQCKSENTSNMHWVIMHPLENSGYSPNGDGLHVLKRDSFYNLLVSVAY